MSKKNFDKMDAIWCIGASLVTSAVMYGYTNVFDDGMSLRAAATATVFYAAWTAVIVWGASAWANRWRRKRNDSKDVAA